MGKKRLTGQQQEFVEHYLLTDNAYQSALAAGYAKTTAKAKSYELLQRPEIMKQIERRRKELIRETVNPEKVLLALANIGMTDVHDVAEVEDGMLLIRNTNDIPKGKRLAISGVKEGPHGLEVRLVDRIRALELVGRTLGMFDKKEVENELEDLTPLAEMLKDDQDTDDPVETVQPET